MSACQTEGGGEVPACKDNAQHEDCQIFQPTRLSAHVFLYKGCCPRRTNAAAAVGALSPLLHHAVYQVV